MRKKDFIINEFVNFSIYAGFSTRNEFYPIYNMDSSEFSLNTAKELRNEIRKFLFSSYLILKTEQMSEEKHVKQIESLSSQLSKKYKSVLYKGKFRIGVSQKIYNLFLKYLWSVNLIGEPIHCPFDNIVKSKLQKFVKQGSLIDWTEMKTIKQYFTYVRAASAAAKSENTTIAKWEMTNWKRRNTGETKP